MRAIFTALILFSTLLTLNAQREQTLFGRAKFVGAFGAPILEIYDYDGSTTTSLGGGGAIIVGSFFFGGYGVGTTNFAREVFENNNDFSLDMGHGGLWFGLSIPQYKLVHPYASFRMGWGGLDIDFENEPTINDAIFVMTPELGVEVNVASWFKLAATAGYRKVNGIKKDGDVATDAFDGFIAGITFRFGGFGHWRYHNYHRED